MASGRGISGTAIFVILAGSALAYGAIKNKRVSAVIGSFVKGENPASAPTQPSFVTETLASGAVVSGSGVTTPGEHSGGYSGYGGGTPAKNQTLARMLAAPYGWSTGNEWDSLVSLWDRESGWNNYADTRVTHAGGDNASSAVFAYGIAQARPYSKMPLAAWPPDKGGIASATAQIAWGLAYIKQSYGSPSAAWAHETANGWY